jgi:predicted metal-dependent HD superfamily phosphohydrolase
MSELELRVAWEAHVATDTAWFDTVLDLHRQPHRRYHGVRHVGWVVRHVLELGTQHAGRVADLGAVVAAAFFHDAVYEATRTDNEAVSAALARRALGELGWAVGRADTVAELVLATAAHVAVSDPDGPLDAAVLLAADLAVLAADPASYAEYVTGVRAEYAHVSDADWAVGRGRVLRGFAGRPAIYDPALALDGWERRARGNIAAELSELDRPVGGLSDG